MAQANEPDAERRAEIERAVLAATREHLGPHYQELIESQHACALELGWASYADMCAHCKRIDLRALSEQTAAFSAASAASYRQIVDPELRRTLGIGLDELRRADLARFFRAVEQDRHFPSARLIESFAGTMAGLGTDVSAQPGVTFDIGSRPNKAPRAFCAPVRVPGEVYLVVAPVGGWDDYVTLFHEGGHTEHSAHVDAGLPFEFRCLGDNSVTETYAFVIQHLVEDPEWLSRRLGIDDASDLVAHAKAQRLVYLRRYAGKLAYELELHGGGPDGDWDALATRYAQLLGAAVKIEWRPTETFLCRRRSRLLLRLLPACMGARDSSAHLPARALRPGLVRVTRGRGGAARAVARRPAPRRRGAPRRADRRAARLRRGPYRPRAERLEPRI